MSPNRSCPNRCQIPAVADDVDDVEVDRPAGDDGGLVDDNFCSNRPSCERDCVQKAFEWVCVENRKRNVVMEEKKRRRRRKRKYNK